MSNKIKWNDQQDNPEPVKVSYVDEDGNEVDPNSDFEIIDEVIEFTNPPKKKTQEYTKKAKPQSEALKRIQKAKLYEVLITHDLIGEGSADPDTIAEVQEEIQQFFSARLDFLLGLSTDGQPAQNHNMTQLPFTDEQINALIAISNRMVEKSSAQPDRQPNVKPLQSATQKVKVKPAENNDVTDALRYTTPTVSDTVRAGKTVKVKTRAQKTSGRRSGQIIDKNRPPLKMPTQAEWDMINARNVQQNQSGADSLVSRAIGAALQKNSSIKEDIGPTE